LLFITFIVVGVTFDTKLFVVGTLQPCYNAHSRRQAKWALWWNAPSEWHNVHSNGLVDHVGQS